MRRELSALKGDAVEYSVLTVVSPPRLALSVMFIASERRFTLVPNVGSEYVAPFAGGTKVSYEGGAIAEELVETPAARTATLERANARDRKTNERRISLVMSGDSYARGSAKADGE